MPAQTQRASGFSYGASARVGMPQFSVSDADQAIFNTVARQGLKHWVCGADLYAAGQSVADRASGTLWSRVGGDTDFGTDVIEGEPAITFTHGDTGSLVSGVDRLPGSFTVAIVYGQSTPQVADNVNRLLFSSGPEVGNLLHSRWSGGTDTLMFHRNNGGDVVNATRGAGQTFDLFSFDADANVATILDKNGAVSATATWSGDPPTGEPWQIGGFNGEDIYSFAGLFGDGFILDRALHLAENARVLRDFTAAVRAKYAFA